MPTDDAVTAWLGQLRAGEAAAGAFHRAMERVGGADPNALARLYHAALARSDVDRFYEGVREGGYDYGEEGSLFDFTGVPDERIAVRVDTRPVRDLKLAVILAHRTQIGEWERIPEPLRWLVLDSECFVQAYPPAQPRDERRSDLFEDLSPAAGSGG